MEEKWSPIKGYEGLYEVSDLGRVKSLPKIRNAGSTRTLIHRKETILKPYSNPRGYHIVTLCNLNDRRAFTVHSLVWDAFGDKPRNGRILQVDHINAMKTDNRMCNLQLLTNRENSQKKVIQNGKMLPVGVCRFQNRYRATITLKNSRNKHLGLFKTVQDAKSAYDNFVRNNYDLL